MLSLGMDIGTSTVKLVLLRDGAMAKQWMAVHHGRPFACLKKGLSAFALCNWQQHRSSAGTGSRYSLFWGYPGCR